MLSEKPKHTHTLSCRACIYFIGYCHYTMPLGRSKEPLLALFSVPWGLAHGNLFPGHIATKYPFWPHIVSRN